MESGISDEHVVEDNEDHSIANRTRSRIGLNDFEPNDNLNFPDVDMSLYHDPGSQQDSEYKNFLTQLYGPEVGTDVPTDDDDLDYEYNNDIFSHGWRFDVDEEFKRQESIYQATEDEHVSIQGDASEITGENENLSLALPSPIKSPLKYPKRRMEIFNDLEFAKVLNQQLRQHIQLLAQTYLLTKFTKNMQDQAEEAKSHLNSYMKIFKSRSMPSNLLPTFELVNNLPVPKDVKDSIRVSWRPLPVPGPVSRIIEENPHIFMYPSLLPEVAFSCLPEKLLPKKPKINFTLNEDKLLAYALNEFKGESSPYAFIASLLMTAKTKIQISNHIKNIKRSPGCEDNPIKLYYSKGELPKIDLSCDLLCSQEGEREKEEAEEEAEKTVSDQVKTEQQGTLVSISESIEGASLFSKPRNCEQVIDEPIPEGCDIMNHNEHNPVEPPDAEYMYEKSISYRDPDDLMNMDLEDLMTASTTISRSTNISTNNSSDNNKSSKNMKLKKSMINLMSHNFLISADMGDLITCDFLKSAQQQLGERDYLHLLQLLTDLMKRESKNEANDETTITIYREVIRFLQKLNASEELQEKMVLFLDIKQANECGCAESYLHWMRFFKFMQHIQLYHDGGEAFEKKLLRLIDALQKDDPHKIKLAIGNLVNKHPFLKREFESLSLDGKPHPSLFICEEDFDDITDAIASFDASGGADATTTSDHVKEAFYFEHFSSKMSKDELNLATQCCPCKCHLSTLDNCINGDSGIAVAPQLSPHCGNCNLRFMKGRMYLVNKIKPLLAEWSHSTSSVLAPPTVAVDDQPSKQTSTIGEGNTIAPVQTFQGRCTSTAVDGTPHTTLQGAEPTVTVVDRGQKWSFEEDREILEFCRAKADQNEESASFDTTTFEELVVMSSQTRGQDGVGRKKSAKEIADRFNQLMDMYKEESSDAVV